MSNIAPLPAAAPAPRLIRATAASARFIAWLAVTLFAVLLLAWLALHWAILPHIDRWRPLIETETSRVLGIPVRIGSIEARSSGWLPSVELHDVSLLDAQLRPALRLQHVVASISPRSMLASAASLELRLAQLVVDGAQLEVRRDPAGRVFVAGIDFSGPSADSTSDAADWFFRQHEVAIRGSTLRWTDEQRAAPPLVLEAVDLVVRNTLRSHALRLDATPPSAWGERFSLRAELTQPLLARSTDWRHWSGQGYADVPRADASQLRRYVDLPFELSSGTGAVRAWIDVREGVARGIAIDLALQEVALRLGAGLEPLVVQRLQGRLVGQALASGGSIALQHFEFLTGDGVQWPAGDLELRWARLADGTVASGTFIAGRLDLAVVAQTAARLPIGETVRRLLAECEPQGIASDVRASWSGPLDALAQYRIAAQLSGLSLAAVPAARADEIGRPGLRHAALTLNATEKGGEARLSMKDGSIDLPGVLAEPVVPLDALQAQLQWRIEPGRGTGPAVQVRVIDAHMANADAQGEFRALWSTGTGPDGGHDARLPGRLELEGTLTRGIAARTARYLPLGLPQSTRNYLQQALQGGSFSRATFRVNGPLRDFPFVAASPGEFRVALRAEDLTLAYVPGAPAAAAPRDGARKGAQAPPASPWPPMTRVNGDIVVDRASLEFRDAKAQIYGVELDALRGGIANLAERPQLTLETKVRGPAADMLRFVNATPVGDWLQGALREATASGNAELKLALALPLADPAQARVSGSLQLAGNELRVRRDLPLLVATHGRVDFTNRSLAIVDAGARVLGGEAAIDGGTQPDGSLRFTAQGRAAAEALRLAPDLGPLARLALSLSGQAAYRLSVAVHGAGVEVDLKSDLVGLAIDLPPPLRKTAEAALPLHVQTTLVPGAPGAGLDTLQVQLGPVVRARFERETQGGTTRVLRGGIGIFEPAPTPASGVAAAVTLDRLDLDAWEAAAGRLFGGVSPPGDATDAGYAPTQIGLKVQELSFAGRTLTQVSAGLSQLDGQWRATLDAEQLAGYVEYRPPAPAPGPGRSPQAGRVYARLARLSLPRSEAEEVTDLLDRQPASVPALDIVIDDLELRGRRLGRMEVQAVNRLVPTREWELTRLKLSVPEAQLSATGRWAATADAPGPRPAPAARRRAAFNFELDVADSGALLQRLGSAEAMRGGKGRLQGQVEWVGSPLWLDIPSLSGQVKVDLAQGQFLQVQPGAARLLGVLSMQALARRLTGDFRDFFQEGFVFDSIAGNVAIARGVASTDNLVIRGVQAVVLMEGSADIAQETQNLRVVVVPEINAGAVSLAVAVINPLVGLGTFLAQLFLRDPLAQANTREFHVSGPWADPQVDQVARQPGANARPENGAPTARPDDPTKPPTAPGAPE